MFRRGDPPQNMAGKLDSPEGMPSAEPATTAPLLDQEKKWLISEPPITKLPIYQILYVSSG
jgi:hypothetical protein